MVPWDKFWKKFTQIPESKNCYAVIGDKEYANWNEIPPETFSRDLGFLRAWSVFEVMMAKNGKIFHFEEHARRLLYGMKILGLFPPYGIREKVWEEKALAILAGHKYRGKGSYFLIKIILTGGQTRDGITQAGSSSIFIFAEEFDVVLFEDREPLTLYMKAEGYRYCSGIKTPANYTASALLFNAAGGKPAEQDFLFDLSETSRGNFFLVTKEGDFLTSVVGLGRAVDGITAQTVKKLIGRDMLGRIEEKSITFEDISKAEEVFVTSTGIGVCPVSSVRCGNKTMRFKTGPGTATARVAQTFEKFREDFFSS